MSLARHDKPWTRQGQDRDITGTRQEQDRNKTETKLAQDTAFKGISCGHGDIESDYSVYSCP